MERQLSWLWYRGLLNLCRMASYCPCRASVGVNVWLAFTTLLFQTIPAGYCTTVPVNVFAYYI